MFKTAVLAAVLCLLMEAAPAQPPAAGGKMLAHNVYFTLKDKTQPAREKLAAACQRYLKNHPGVIYFATGIRAPELAREVNDAEFDVSLVVVFRNKADHDRYQVAADHKKFIAENQAGWARVRVFDSYVQ